MLLRNTTFLSLSAPPIKWKSALAPSDIITVLLSGWTWSRNMGCTFFLLSFFLVWKRIVLGISIAYVVLKIIRQIKIIRADMVVLKEATGRACTTNAPCLLGTGEHDRVSDIDKQIEGGRPPHQRAVVRTPRRKAASPPRALVLQAVG